jgi:PAS domain-containing protein
LATGRPLSARRRRDAGALLRHPPRRPRHLVAIGRNLQGIAALQQRLVDAQQSLERDYWRLRQLETRYRLLFRSASDAIVIIDPETSKVVEANPAAALLLTADSRRLVGRASRTASTRRAPAPSSR